MTMNNSNRDNQGASVAKVITWMVVFLMLYLPLVLLVLACVAGCVGGAVAGGVIAAQGNIFMGTVFILLAIAAGYFLAYPFGRAILRPFFILYNNENEQRIEITEADAPELVGLIYNIADLTGNERPVHIYVSAEANACVFFDTKFANIFVPVKKNIQVGLGVFRHMSLEETTSCIAHEFGHFSQDRMRWGTVVYILNTLITDLMGINDRWNTVVNHLINFPWIGGQGIVASIAIKLVGWILYGATISYTATMRAIDRKIQLAHWELSRKMEFEADDVAARIVGSEAYVSFTYKMIEASKREDRFTTYVQQLASDNLLISDYWTAYAQLETYIEQLTGNWMDSQQTLTAPLTPIAEAQLLFEEINCTHPHWSKRIAAAKASAYPRAIKLSGKAWDIVPQGVKDEVGKACVDALATLCDAEQPVSHLSNVEFGKQIDADFYGVLYDPYLGHDIIPFDTDQCKPSIAFTPNNKEYLLTMSQYATTKSEYENAKSIMQSRAISEVIYKGVTYKVSHMPIDEIEKEFREQEQKVALIDQSICALALAKAHDASTIKSAYSILFYTQQFLHEFEQYVTGREEYAIELLNSSHSSTNSRQFKKIQKTLEDLNKWFYTFGPDSMDKDFFNDFAEEEEQETLKQYEAQHESLFTGDQITGESIKLLFTAIRCIHDFHKLYQSRAERIIVDTCLGRES